ncbi:MAG: IS630 transposase-related protein [Cyanobacteria bacterium P01_F01_bin.153]
MSYSQDLRQRVIDFVKEGGSKAEAARLFKISRGRVYVWLNLPPEQLAPKKTGPKKARKLDMEQLRETIQQEPELLQKELAQRFEVHETTIYRARKRLKITRKKDLGLH